MSGAWHCQLRVFVPLGVGGDVARLSRIFPFALTNPPGRSRSSRRATMGTGAGDGGLPRCQITDTNSFLPPDHHLPVHASSLRRLLDNGRFRGLPHPSAGLGTEDAHPELKRGPSTLKITVHGAGTPGNAPRGFQPVECESGSLVRTVPLPPGLDLDRAEARVKYDVLTRHAHPCRSWATS